MAFYWYNESNCTEDNDAIQKYLSTDRKLKIHLQEQSHSYDKMSQMQKTLLTIFVCCIMVNKTLKKAVHPTELQ